MCHDYAPGQQKEPLIPSPISDLPWAMAASDIFTFESEQFLVLVDYYSKYIEVTKLKDLTSQETIQALEEHFGRHGIPARLITDCSVQYTSKEFTDFAKSYNFEHVLISPKHPQANGEAEAAVKTVKSLWRKNASILQSHPHPRNWPVSISALHGPQAEDHLTNGNWSTET